MAATRRDPTHGPETDRILRLRVTVAGSEPPIWRLIDVDASLTLDALHHVLQTVLGWRGWHLHSFTDTDPTLPRRRVVDGGPEPRVWSTGDILDDGLGLLDEATVRLGEVFTEQTGPLFYEYDFGDGWTHWIELVAHGDGDVGGDGGAAARVVDGERRAPLEDSGGIGGYQDLLAVLAGPDSEEKTHAAHWVAATTGPWQDFDPAAFDAEAANRELALLFAPSPEDGDGGDEPRTVLDSLCRRLPPGLQPEFRSFAATAGIGGRAGTGDAEIDDDAAARLVAPYQWLVQRIGPDGLALTSAGWLPPVVVREAADVLGLAGKWFGATNRESQTAPVFWLRDSATRLGLVRKVKGRLLVPQAVQKVSDDPRGLLIFIARAVLLRHRHQADQDAAVLALLELAAGKRSDWDVCLHAVGFGLGALGWEMGPHEELTERDVRTLLSDTTQVLRTMGLLWTERLSRELARTPEARAFARAALAT